MSNSPKSDLHTNAGNQSVVDIPASNFTEETHDEAWQSLQDLGDAVTLTKNARGTQTEGGRGHS